MPWHREEKGGGMEGPTGSQKRKGTERRKKKLHLHYLQENLIEHYSKYKGRKFALWLKK